MSCSTTTVRLSEQPNTALHLTTSCNTSSATKNQQLQQAPVERAAGSSTRRGRDLHQVDESKLEVFRTTSWNFFFFFFTSSSFFSVSGLCSEMLWRLWAQPVCGPSLFADPACLWAQPVCGPSPQPVCGPSQFVGPASSLFVGLA